MSTAAVVLAAGQGTRFKSERAKVLHRLAGRTMLRWVLEAIRPLGLDRVVVVCGHQREEVAAEAQTAAVPGLVTVEQSPQNGTGHAVRQALDAGALDQVDTVLVVPGDAPLLLPEVLADLLGAHDGRAATLVTAEPDDPTGYGRVIRDRDGAVVRIVEHRDASDDERRVREVATSIYAFSREPLAVQLRQLSSDNVQGEEYLTDVVAPLAAAGVGAVTAPAQLVGGVNDRAELAAAAAVVRRRILRRLMLDGVGVVDPAATYVDADAAVDADATLLPGTHLEGATRVGRHAVIGPNSRLVEAVVEDGATVAYSVVERATVGVGATVGPFSYLRPGTRLEGRAKAGAFVEMKNTTVGTGSKVPHLSYIGDATIGRDANVGAGTITCNYDGRAKHPTVIGDGAFVGSDTMLVAPVEVGADAYTGAGSVITKDVPPGALAVERGEQRIVAGYADRRAARHEERTRDERRS
ncbi:MAG TPA: bifunctional UDP-N-acetylglucosamine diphosphorylase/glucosamine-1-phosphate N-acetyltransferase GlmU [Egibacteraceae bacterium]|nr:bifunctional UDP-N-acetylglucosamine diphosphorylase/glucosamine-1-phosphate N-acetyltransferase GlmU [Egibacteraceae bacterium]